jgi:methionine--tRNA ligase beta chain
MAKEMITFQEFQDLKLRAARVLSAERVEGTDKLMKMQIDLGDEQRQIVAGIAQEYSPEELVGRDIMVVANLQPAKIRGVESNGMLLAANLGGKPILACFDKPVPPGPPIT